MYFAPDLILPLFIVEIIIAENEDDVIKETVAKILKSVFLSCRQNARSLHQKAQKHQCNTV